MRRSLLYDDIDCVFCVSDAPAFGLMSALKEEGVNVPADIGVAGFGDFEVSRFSSPTITTVKFDAEEVGRVTASLITQLTSQDSSSTKLPRKYTIEVTNLMRGSTRKQ